MEKRKSTSKANKKNNSKDQDLTGNREQAKNQYLTTNQGLRINDDQNSLKTGDQGRSPAVNKTGSAKTQNSKDAEKKQWSSDEGIILGRDTRMNDVAKKFIAAIGRHCFWDRELKSTTSA